MWWGDKAAERPTDLRGGREVRGANVSVGRQRVRVRTGERESEPLVKEQESEAIYQRAPRVSKTEMRRKQR